MIQAAIDAHIQAAGRVIPGNGSRRGHERARVFSVDPAFHRMAGECHVFLLKRKRFALGDANLFAYKVNASNHFGYRMFDLQSRVHFDEIEITIFPEELDSARAAIAHVGHRLGANIPHAVALGSGEYR